MILLRKSRQRGRSRFDWLDSLHTFSFGEYHDPGQMGFRVLRVINEDRVAPGRGFGTHGHRDMEIITCIIDGALEHKDSLGTGSVIRPGDVQRMSAGTGVMHSEFNASATQSVHFLQVWIVPERRGIPPGYQQKSFPSAERAGQLRLVASPDGSDGSVMIHQDARLYMSTLQAGQSVTHEMPADRHVWLQIVRGTQRVRTTGAADTPLEAGDGAGISRERKVTIHANDASEFLLFDLP